MTLASKKISSQPHTLTSIIKVCIGESPTKAKTLTKFLSADYKVISSFGHVRDLPKSKIGVDVEHDFTPQYVIPPKAKKHVKEIHELAQKADEVILATDEDREGEAIAWHLLTAAKLEAKPHQRIVFHEITKKAIEAALKNPRTIQMDLVNAQQARRILDRLVGYELSPLLWKKIARGLSAGRVQSVAVRLIVEREREIEQFKPQEYWSINANFQKDGIDFSASLVKKDGKKLDKFAIPSQTDTQMIVNDLSGSKYIVSTIDKKEIKKRPLPPYTTSTLQQDASNKLGYSAKQTMMLAQKLYESGYITYMRTDSQNLSADAVANARTFIENNFGAAYLPDAPIFYKTSKKGAQEAHEAIRPTNPTAKKIDNLEPKQAKIYDLIWSRMMACQMTPAIFDSTAVEISASNYTFKANGSILKFDGYQKVYRMQSKETVLPALKTQEILDFKSLTPEQHHTEPPARYTEAGLVKTLEEYGIGRPSTYAPTISTIQERNYVIKNEDKRFVPTDIGKTVNDMLVEHFPNIVDREFTAHMEEDLDAIAEHGKNWVNILQNFYRPFKSNLAEKENILSKKELTEQKTDELCDKCGSPMVIKVGRFGKFLACSNYPDCKNTKPLGEDGKKEEPEVTEEKCDKCGSPMVIKHGRYGKFLGCSRYPECKNIKAITKGTGVACAKCGVGEIVEKKSKKGRMFYACNQYPSCDFALWSKPTGDKCKICGSLMIAAGKNKTKCSNKECEKSK